MSDTRSLQRCHCGWEEVTTHQGLRTHQDTKGCTKKTSSDCAPQSGPATPKHSQQQEYQQLFQTPQSFRQSAAEGNQTRRALDFLTGAEQAQLSLDVPLTTSHMLSPDCKAEGLRQIQRNQTKAELLQKVCSREQKLCEGRSSVTACKGRLTEEWLEINSVFSDVIKIVLEARQRSLQPLENRKNKLEEAAQSVFTKIQADIEKLEKGIQEVDAAADLEQQVNSLSKLIMKDYGEGALDMSLSFGTLQSILPSMMEQIHQGLKRLAALELNRASTFAEDVKLDPTTAHQWLVVSKDGKEVQDGGQSQQELPPAPGRFDMFGSILGANQFRSGRAYWEVQVGGKTGWDLGVASVNANRKGKLTLAPDQGYWVIVHYEGERYAALTAPPLGLQLKEKPQKVAVFLDYDEGLVSFYDVTNQSHIYSFTNCSFGDGVFPYFSPNLRQNGKNLEPLVITPMTI